MKLGTCLEGWTHKCYKINSIIKEYKGSLGPISLCQIQTVFSEHQLCPKHCAKNCEGSTSSLQGDFNPFIMEET
jgi:hypothetical protein